MMAIDINNGQRSQETQDNMGCRGKGTKWKSETVASDLSGPRFFQWTSKCFDKLNVQ